MSHLNERIADFVFEELSTGEMAEAGRHIAECSDCRAQVESFQRTHQMLKTSPDLDPPRNIVFEFEKPARRTSGAFWKWLAPLAATAALALGIAVMAPIHVQWHESQLTVTFGGTAAGTDQSPSHAQLAEELQTTQAAVKYLLSVQEQANHDIAMMNTSLISKRSEGGR